MFASFKYAPTKKQFVILFCAAFLIRAATFFFFISHTDRFARYRQPDSPDYHNAALCLALGNGMSQPGNNNPIFWRTPGYPLYLAIFYAYYGIHSGVFEENSAAQKTALWMQIFLCSFIPIILWYLAYMLTHSYTVAWLTAWIAVFHLGLVLASTFFLTEGLAVLFFYLFLLYFLRMFLYTGMQNYTQMFIAMIMLSIYTWIRPMGEFVGILSSFMIIIFGQHNFFTNLKHALTFYGAFFVTLLPWYIRNYKRTGDWFFCPLSGVYLNVFCAPKILRRTMNLPLKQTWQYCVNQANNATRQAHQAIQGTGMFPSPLISKQVALPILLASPFYFCIDWLKEICKTTFDLYASQLVAFANGTFFYDPLEEFLTEKIAACLWTQPMPLLMRAICWFEFVWNIALWIGLIAGAWHYVIQPLWRATSAKESLFWTWILCGIMVGAVIGMTGGFGYARLRLPVEPLMIILSLTYWYPLIKRTQ